MSIAINGQVGVQTLADGATQTVRLGKSAEVVVQELHGRFYEQNYRTNLYSGGISALTSISNATFTIATTGATATPIVGLYNPLASPVNAVILQASLAVILTALTATGGAPFVWATASSSAALTATTTAPMNRKTLQQAGSQCKVFGGQALTGMTGTLVAQFGSALPGGPPINTSQTYTVSGIPFTTGVNTENFDGSLIVPPGGIIALLATTTPVALSAVSALLWEEVPI